MSESQKEILEMLADKKISIDEAYRLLSLPGADRSEPESTTGTGTAKPKPKYLWVTAVPGPDGEHDHAEMVKVRVPMSLIRSGMKFTSLIPAEARDKVSEALRDKGIDFDMRNLKPEDFEEIIEALSELEVNVVSPEEVIKVYAE